jgi:hypothetical protein
MSRHQVDFLVGQTTRACETSGMLNEYEYEHHYLRGGKAWKRGLNKNQLLEAHSMMCLIREVSSDLSENIEKASMTCSGKDSHCI